MPRCGPACSATQSLAVRSSQARPLRTMTKTSRCRPSGNTATVTPIVMPRPIAISSQIGNRDREAVIFPPTIAPLQSLGPAARSTTSAGMARRPGISAKPGRGATGNTTPLCRPAGERPWRRSIPTPCHRGRVRRRGADSLLESQKDVFCARVRASRAQRELRGCQGAVPRAAARDSPRPPGDARRVGHRLTRRCAHAAVALAAICCDTVRGRHTTASTEDLFFHLERLLVESCGRGRGRPAPHRAKPQRHRHDDVPDAAARVRPGSGGRVALSAHGAPRDRGAAPQHDLRRPHAHPARTADDARALSAGCDRAAGARHRTTARRVRHDQPLPAGRLRHHRDRLRHRSPAYE